MKQQELQNITQQVLMDYQSRGGSAEITDEEKEELEAIADRRVRLGSFWPKSARKTKSVSRIRNCKGR